MKLFVLFFITFTLLFANERPKIALVLSGGGARGGAHVGVLKVLEQNRIPVDMIIGTSMGSFMGGLYATGKTPEELEQILVTTDWHKFIRSDLERQKIPMQRKLTEYTYQGKLGVGINAAGEIALPTGVLKREPLLLKFGEFSSDALGIKNFDNLSIPFRAVATNIKNGKAVVLGSGSLAEAMYASSAIPGGFQPIKIDGKDLVDGGINDNLPIDVARQMGADIIIAVDVSEDFSQNLDLNSYLVVVNQLVDIMTRKNVVESIKLLKEDDILITPKLEGYSGLDVEKYAQIIDAGYAAALTQVKKLQKYSLSKEEYAKYKELHRKKERHKALIISAIEIQNNTYLSNAIIKKQIRQKVGKVFDVKALHEDILELYNLTVFDSITYRIMKKDGKNTLLITTEPSWDNRGDLLFSLSLDDDFNGHSAYSLKLGYLMYGINDLGAEWRTDAEIGKKQRFATEFYQPLDFSQMYYVRPFLSYEKTTYIVPTESVGNQELKSRGYGGGLAFGANMTRSFRIELNAAAYRDKSDVEFEGYSQEFNARQIKARVLFDSLDNYNYPNKGMLGKLELKKDAKSWGSDYDYEQFFLELQKPLSVHNNTLILNAKIGLTDVKSKNSGDITVYDKFILGGMFNLSGYPANSFAGNNVAFGSLMYRYRIKNGGFFGSLGVPLYGGLSLEGGSVWKDGKNLNKSSLKSSAALFVSADTPLGAFYLTYGYADAEHENLYLYLGEKF